MRILFFCLGNICRSPTAEAVGRAQGLDCDSAGTAGWHVGKPPYAPMQEAARACGIGMSDLRARQLSAADFARFDLLIAMDEENRADAERLRPAGNATPIKLLTEFGEGPETEVPDPYYTRDFDGTLALVQRRIAALARDLQAETRPLGGRPAGLGP